MNDNVRRTAAEIARNRADLLRAIFQSEKNGPFDPPDYKFREVLTLVLIEFAGRLEQPQDIPPPRTWEPTVCDTCGHPYDVHVINCSGAEDCECGWPRLS